jgi:hypothetical protein
LKKKQLKFNGESLNTSDGAQQLTAAFTFIVTVLLTECNSLSCEILPHGLSRTLQKIFKLTAIVFLWHYIHTKWVLLENRCTDSVKHTGVQTLRSKI